MEKLQEIKNLEELIAYMNKLTTNKEYYLYYGTPDEFEKPGINSFLYNSKCRK